MRGNILAYGLLGLPLAFAALPVYVHVPRVYAARAGMDLALLGLILLGARLADAVLDPWLGCLADRLPKRRILVFALVPLAIGFVALLNPAASHATAWLLASLTLTYVGFSAATVAYQAWGADIAPDSAARTRLTAAREGFGLGGVVLAAALPAMLSADPAEGVARLAWALPPLLLVSAAVTLGSVGDGARRAEARGTAGRGLLRVIRDPAFSRLLAVFLVNGVAAAVPATLFLFFVADVLRAEEFAGPLLALYFIAGAVSLPLWVRLASAHGRPAAWLVAMGLAVLAFAGCSLLGAGDVGAFAVICAASGLALGADLALPAAIAADLGERQGQAGAFFGVWNLVAKLNLALAAGLALPLLGGLGYAPGGSAGLAALTFTYALLPLALKALAAALLWRWRGFLEIHS
ncbi:MFS transporter [Azoarcus sp. KH32C]|uniref:MFS transporter n=1 Tax=Azoarcus sp. KH32C TaxID=748247 RepID=UPI0002385D45|nr:MFS transporter [Azoarcus sp. KH32C]BAL27526.1 major facilitator superfamily MFS_1 [Azoarcus sp. KH32C]